MQKSSCFAIVAVATFAVAQPVLAANSVFIESKTVVAGARGVEVGIYLSNTPHVGLVHMPFQITEITPGSFIADTLLLIGQGRLAGTLDQANSEQYFAVQHDTLGFVGCWWARAQPDFVSPDAVFYFSSRGLLRRDFCLPPGDDGMPPSGSPSLILRFDVSNVPGTFEIDSTCFGHDGLLFAECYGPVIFTPSFTKGVITIVPCECQCHGDPACDGIRDVLDVTRVIGEAFGATARESDVECGRKTRADINCDCKVDITDVIGMIDVVIRGKDPSGAICDGCSDNCP